VGNIQPALAPIKTNCPRGIFCAINQSEISAEAAAHRFCEAHARPCQNHPPDKFMAEL
jgi:hypothetical protein